MMYRLQSLQHLLSVSCEFPVLLQEAVLGLKTPTPITVLLERGEGFFRQLQVESFPHFGKEQIKSKEERPVQAIFRQTQTDASRLRRTDRQTVSLVNVTQSLDNNISPPKFIWSAHPRCWSWPIDLSAPHSPEPLTAIDIGHLKLNNG